MYVYTIANGGRIWRVDWKQLYCTPFRNSRLPPSNSNRWHQCSWFGIGQPWSLFAKVLGVIPLSVTIWLCDRVSSHAHQFYQQNRWHGNTKALSKPVSQTSSSFDSMLVGSEIFLCVCAAGSQWISLTTCTRSLLPYQKQYHGKCRRSRNFSH